MNCNDAQQMMIDDLRGRLPLDAQAELREHRTACDVCGREWSIESELDSMLTNRLPKFEAPASLRSRLRRAVTLPTVARPTRQERWFPIVLAAALAATTVVLASKLWPDARGRGDDSMIVREAINDHLRIMFSEHPVEVASGGIHQVKPWFAGKVEFAPVVSFSGDDDFPLAGGSVAYFIDRKAAAFLYQRRLHKISLFVFPAEGFRWPSATRTLGELKVSGESMRGFNVLLWQKSGLGYALVSDVAMPELDALATRVDSKN